eukprot:gene14940-20995_t
MPLLRENLEEFAVPQLAESASAATDDLANENAALKKKLEELQSRLAETARAATEHQSRVEALVEELANVRAGSTVLPEPVGGNRLDSDIVAELAACRSQIAELEAQLQSQSAELSSTSRLAALPSDPLRSSLAGVFGNPKGQLVLLQESQGQGEVQPATTASASAGNAAEDKVQPTSASASAPARDVAQELEETQAVMKKRIGAAHLSNQIPAEIVHKKLEEPQCSPPQHQIQQEM